MEKVPRDPCRLCPPGTYRHKPCNGTTPRLCKACPSGTYNRNSNQRPRCRPCSSCKRDEVVVNKCTPTSDVLCKCSPRAFFHRGLISCMKCSRCVKGHGMKTPCGKYHDTECEKCSPGFFSDKKNARQKCEPCNVCRCGKKLPCTIKQDTVCEECITSPLTLSTSTTTQPTPSQNITKKPKQTFAGTTVIEKEKIPITFMVVFCTLVGTILITLIIMGIYYLCKKYRKWRQRERVPPPPPPLPPPPPPVQKGKMVCYKKMQETMFRDVPYSVVDILAERLNPESKNDWRKLAGALGINQLRIENLKLERNNATQGLLQEWGYSENASTRTLYNALISISRKDLANFVEPYILKEVVDAT